MAKSGFELNINGLREVMKSAEMQSAVNAAGSAVASAAGVDYGTRPYIGSYTAMCAVFATSSKAYGEVLEEKSLLKAAGAVGLRTG